MKSKIRIFTITVLILVFIAGNVTSALADDDGSDVAVGRESNEDYYLLTGDHDDDINYSTDCVDGLIDIVDDTSTSWNEDSCNYVDEDVWERDFRSSSVYVNGYSGSDYRLSDDVDLFAYSGHGRLEMDKGPIMIEDEKEQPYALRTQIRWGDRDLEWALMYTCNFLNPSLSNIGPMMNGTHMICGYATVMWITNNGGEVFAEKAIASYSVLNSWSYYAGFTQPQNQTEDVVFAQLCHSSTINDKLWGYGTVASDPTSYNTSTTGYYKITSTLEY